MTGSSSEHAWRSQTHAGTVSSHLPDWALCGGNHLGRHHSTIRAILVNPESSSPHEKSLYQQAEELVLPTPLPCSHSPLAFPTPRHSWCLTWQALHDFIEITPVHGKSNPSLSQQLRLLQRKAGETQEWRQSQRNLSQKGYSREIFTHPRHLEADVCTQTQHFTSVHSLIGFPGLPHFSLMVLPHKRHPSQHRAGEKSLKSAQVEFF